MIKNGIWIESNSFSLNGNKTGWPQEVVGAYKKG
jgi:hypothetical protein